MDGTMRAKRQVSSHIAFSQRCSGEQGFDVFIEPGIVGHKRDECNNKNFLEGRNRVEKWPQKNCFCHTFEDINH